MNTCKTCRHWQFKATDPDAWKFIEYCEPEDIDTGLPMKLPFNVRACRHPAQTFCERPVEADGFGVADGSTYMAVLVTAEDFGCIRHEVAAV